MEKEQIIKALECISNTGDVLCEGCAYRKYDGLACHRIGAKNALALIKELTIELDAMRGAANSYKMHNERLTEENERLKAIPEQLHREMSERMLEERKIERKLAVREMQEKAKAEAYVPKPYGMSKVVDVGTIDHIADEILNENTEE